jgi:hypothetical protein
MKHMSRIAAAAKHSKWSRGTASNCGECQDRITEGIVTRLGRNRKGRLRCAKAARCRVAARARRRIAAAVDWSEKIASLCRLSLMASKLKQAGAAYLGSAKCPLSGCEAGIRRQIKPAVLVKKNQLSRRAPLPRANFGRYDLVVGRMTCPRT